MKYFRVMSKVFLKYYSRYYRPMNTERSSEEFVDRMFYICKCDKVYLLAFRRRERYSCIITDRRRNSPQRKGKHSRLLFRQGERRGRAEADSPVRKPDGMRMLMRMQTCLI